MQTVSKAVNSLNSDESDGDRGYNSNHLLYAGHMFYAELSSLLKSMYYHGHQPEALLFATIVSIHRGALCCDSNYRGIALSCSIGKVYNRLFIK